jgi:RNA polymerase sigma factor (sigma-70 family)
MPLAEPSQTTDPESLFLASLPVINRITAILGRRYALPGSEVEEFESWARARLIEADYSVFRKFAGRSSLDTYLSVVLANLFKDFRNSRWGRWRPSAIAKRLGPLAIRFETLVYRDGHATREAIEVLKGQGAEETELRSLAARIPPRVAAKEVALGPFSAAIPGFEHADQLVRTAESEAEQARTEASVGSALAELPVEDRVIVRMRFWDGHSVADIARILGLEQKSLYRRLDAIQRSLAGLLESRGLNREHIAKLLTAGEVE